MVDNGSTDATPSVVRSHGARALFEKRRGYGSACLTGIAALNDAEIVVFLDGDYSDYPDQMDRIVESLERFSTSDLLILAGGVSAGRLDLVPDALRQVGAEIIFHKVRQKPGKPLLFARRGDQLIFGLPGNPLACHFCFHRYVGPAIRKMQGRDPSRPTRSGRLAKPVKPKGGRPYFLLGLIDDSADPEGLPKVHPTRTKSSADLFRKVAPNCYLEIPPGSDTLPPGTKVHFTRIDGI